MELWVLVSVVLDRGIQILVLVWGDCLRRVAESSSGFSQELCRIHQAVAWLVGVAWPRVSGLWPWGVSGAQAGNGTCVPRRSSEQALRSLVRLLIRHRVRWAVHVGQLPLHAHMGMTDRSWVVLLGAGGWVETGASPPSSCRCAG